MSRELAVTEEMSFEDVKVKEFEEKVVTYINSKDKFINRYTTVDTKKNFTRNILGFPTKEDFFVALEGLCLCRIEKKYSYSSISAFLYSKMVATEEIKITRVMDEKEDIIIREYDILPTKINSYTWKLIKEVKGDITVTYEYDRKYRAVNISTYIKDKFDNAEIYKYTDFDKDENPDTSYTVEQYKQPSEDVDPVFISKIYVDWKGRIYRMDTATGESRISIFEGDSKIREEFYINDILVAILKYETYYHTDDEISTLIFSMVKEIYDNNKIFSSSIIEESEKRVDNKTNKLVYFRNTKYHKGIKMIERITTIESKERKDGSRVEKQNTSIVDKSEGLKTKSEENIIDYNKDGNPTLIVTIKPNAPTLYTTFEDDEDKNQIETSNDDHYEKVTLFDDESGIKEYELKNKYSARVLYNDYNSLVMEAVKKR